MMEKAKRLKRLTNSKKRTEIVREEKQKLSKEVERQKPDNGELSPAEYYIADYAAHGAKQIDIAKLVGKDPSTISQILSKPTVKREVRRIQTEFFERIDNLQLDLYTRLIDSLCVDIQDGNISIEQKMELMEKIEIMRGMRRSVLADSPVSGELFGRGEPVAELTETRQAKLLISRTQLEKLTPEERVRKAQALKELENLPVTVN